jgi:predicted peroxiredoxin
VNAAAPETWVVLLQRGEADALYEAAAMAASATSLGVSVTLVWFDAALEALVAGRIEEAAERGASPSSLLAAARETGRLRSLACSASAVNARAGVESVRSRVDDIVGWPTVVSLMRSASKALVW